MIVQPAMTVLGRLASNRAYASRCVAASHTASTAAHMVIAIVVAIALLALPIASGAQQARTAPRVGLLMHDGTPPGFLESFRAGLKELGYVEGTTSRSPCGMPRATTTGWSRSPTSSFDAAST